MNRYNRHAQPVGQWLDEQPGLDAVLPQVERMAALQADLDTYCTSVRCGMTTARETARRQLAWFAHSPAQAAKLRNLKAGLEEFLARRGWDFSGVVVRLQPDKMPNENSVTSVSHAPKPGLSEACVREWDALARTLEPGPLQDAVAALVRHHQSASE